MKYRQAEPSYRTSAHVGQLSTHLITKVIISHVILLPAGCKSIDKYHLPGWLGNGQGHQFTSTKRPQDAYFGVLQLQKPGQIIQVEQVEQIEHKNKKTCMMSTSSNTVSLMSIGVHHHLLYPFILFQLWHVFLQTTLKALHLSF